MYSLLVDAVRLKVMLAWSSTLGGAYSALGDNFIQHVSKRITMDPAQKCRQHLLQGRCNYENWWYSTQITVES